MAYTVCKRATLSLASFHARQDAGGGVGVLQTFDNPGVALTTLKRHCSVGTWAARYGE